MKDNKAFKKELSKLSKAKLIEAYMTLYYAHKDLEYASNTRQKVDRKQIRSLEEQLKNAEIRKYKLNEEVYVVWHEMVIDVRIYAYWRDKEYYYVDTCHFDLSEEGGLVLKESDIFKEYEEAQARLAELKGEGK